jgi:hypothetical protein
MNFDELRNEMVKRGILDNKKRTPSKYDSWTTEELIVECKKRGIL